ncbi:protein of unknown function DUF29 [Gloeothece citriformis PCC 7424]|uniref:DUF29 domain-containing protein n=1 Tax=Gloeothece citriformis (strain PCC 7424) TaxID=65393 RepID=B7KK96_GLOC7|nr:DUF29 domain-containing protein [Gloeothece citriformis]ACK70981.1 protein of unknown function DUF29 [Gloeothece citriformis PCC 7424]
MSQVPTDVGKNESDLKKMPIYERDFYQWTIEQAQALREQKLEAIDWINLTDEIESLGNEQLHAVESYLKQLIPHKFKLQYVNDQYSRKGWEDEIDNFLDEIEDRLTNSMRPKIDLDKIYQRARRNVLKRYPLLEKTLPQECPYTLDELVSR